MKRNQAFTLLEMIVAIAVFSVIAVISYASLNRFLDHRDALQDKMDSMKELQLTFSLLQQDMHFISARVVRDAYGDPEPLLMVNNGDVDGELLRFTAARPNVYLPETSTLKRVAYRLQDGDFLRINWQVLDRDQDSKETRHLLLSDVENVTVNMLQATESDVDRSNNGDVNKEDKMLAEWDATESLPDGVEWTIQLANGKSYRRVFEVIGRVEESR